MDQVRISGAQSRRSQKLVLALVLALQIEAEEDHSYGQAGVTR